MKLHSRRFARSSWLRQRGYTLAELAVGTTVVAAASVAAVKGFQGWDMQLRAKDLGDNLSPVYAAVQSYVQKNVSQLQSGSAIAGFANIYAPTITELKTASLLNGAYVPGTNQIGANVMISLARTPTGCAPVNCDITWTVNYDRPIVTKAGLPDIQTASLASKAVMNAAGGYSTLVTPGVFNNSDGSWSLVTNPTGQAGVVAAYGTLNSSGNAAYVRVADNRDPNLQGALTVQGNIAGKTNISALGSVTAGTDVTASGQVYSGAWIRNTAAGTGWYQQAHGGGMYMSDNTWMRAYNDKGIYTGGQVQAGSIQSNGGVTALSNVISYGSNYAASNTWAVLGYDGGWGAPASPQSAVGSAYLNDAYFRSVGKWASQMGNGMNTGAAGTYCQGGVYCGHQGYYGICYGVGGGAYGNQIMDALYWDGSRYFSYNNITDSNGFAMRPYCNYGVFWLS